MAKAKTGSGTRKRAGSRGAGNGDNLTVTPGGIATPSPELPPAGDTEPTLADRLRDLQEQFGGEIVREPTGVVVDRRMRYRWLAKLPNGDVVSGNGADNAEAVENLERRLAAWSE
jgi:hypothetical protein